MDDYIGELTFAGAEGSDELEAEKSRFSLRQHALMLQRQGRGGPASGLQPRKRHRKSSMQWTGHLHKMLLFFYEKGLFHFQVGHIPGSRPRAVTWPRLSLSPDQGSDGVCGSNYCLGPLFINVDMAWDQSHMCHNDIWDGFKEAGEYHRVAFVLLRLNIPVSPWQENWRWRQVVNCIEEMFSNFQDPRGIPFFEEMEHELLHEAAGQRFLSEEQPHLAYWRHLKENHCFKERGTKIMIGR